MKILSRIGTCYEYRGQYSKALKLYEQCREMAKKVYIKDNLEIGDVLDAIGRLFNNLSRY